MTFFRMVHSQPLLITLILQYLICAAEHRNHRSCKTIIFEIMMFISLETKHNSPSFLDASL